MFRLFALLLLTSLPLLAQSTPPAPAGIHCTADHTAPSEADNLLNAEKYEQAQQAYQAMLAAKPGDENARLGLVRVMIGRDQVMEAEAAAAAFVREQPASGIAEIAAAEADYRAGKVEESFAHARNALRLAPCDGRTSIAIARPYRITGLFAKSAALVAQAHRLRPLDEDITESWIRSLPRQQRLKELTTFLDTKPSLSGDDERSLNTEQQFLQARKTGECHIVSSTPSTQTAMQVVYGDQTRPMAYGLDVLFDGKRRRMQIDTGAGGILLTDSAARGLGLQPEYHLKTGGIGDEGKRDSYLTHIHSMRIGGVELQDCTVEVVSKAKLGVDGLIGMDVFGKWLVTLDYQNGRLQLDPLPPRPGVAPATAPGSPSQDADDDDAPHDRYVAPEMKSWLPVARIGHQILLPASLKRDGASHFMIMDTGAQTSTFSLPFAKAAGKLHSSSVQFSGISGKMKQVFETDPTELYVGTLHLPADVYYAFDVTNISHNLGFEVAGLLGLPTLQRLTIQIDYRDNLLKLTYDPKHDRQRF